MNFFDSFLMADSIARANGLSRIERDAIMFSSFSVENDNDDFDFEDDEDFNNDNS